MITDLIIYCTIACPPPPPPPPPPTPQRTNLRPRVDSPYYQEPSLRRSDNIYNFKVLNFQNIFYLSLYQVQIQMKYKPRQRCEHSCDTEAGTNTQSNEACPVRRTPLSLSTRATRCGCPDTSGPQRPPTEPVRSLCLLCTRTPQDDLALGAQKFLDSKRPEVRDTVSIHSCLLPIGKLWTN